MDKLIIILIGLSIIGRDPKEKFEGNLYQRIFRKNSDKEIKLVYHNFGSRKTDGGTIIVVYTLTMPARTKKKEYFENGYSSDGIKEDDFGAKYRYWGNKKITITKVNGKNNNI